MTPKGPQGELEVTPWDDAAGLAGWRRFWRSAEVEGATGGGVRKVRQDEEREESEESEESEERLGK